MYTMIAVLFTVALVTLYALKKQKQKDTQKKGTENPESVYPLF